MPTDPQPDELRHVDGYDFLTRQEAAAYAGVSVATIDRARKRGGLKWVSTHPGKGGGVRTKRPWIDTWLEQNRC